MLGSPRGSPVNDRPLLCLGPKKKWGGKKKRTNARAKILFLLMNEALLGHTFWGLMAGGLVKGKPRRRLTCPPTVGSIGLQPIQVRFLSQRNRELMPFAITLTPKKKKSRVKISTSSYSPWCYQLGKFTQLQGSHVRKGLNSDQACSWENPSS